MRRRRNLWTIEAGLYLVVVLAVAGCQTTPVDTSDYAQGPAPRRMPSPAREAEGSCSYEDSLTGGQVFTMYCSYCHNAPNLSERNFANFKNVAAHMRVRANLTGKEYARLMEFLQRWNDVPPPTPPLEPSPTRFNFSQPIPELRPPSDKKTPDPAGGPQTGVVDPIPPQPAPALAPPENR